MKIKAPPTHSTWSRVGQLLAIVFFGALFITATTETFFGGKDRLPQAQYQHIATR